MAHRRLYYDEPEKILDRANELLFEAGSEVNVQQESQLNVKKSITTFCLQLHVPAEQEKQVDVAEASALEEYYAIVEQAVTSYHGDIIAAADNTLLALFSNANGTGHSLNYGVSAAVVLVDQLAMLNKYRLAQDLVPFRIGIGLDTAQIPLDTTNSNRLIAPVLEKHILHAKRLSDLNQQTPFPAVFISRSTAEILMEQSHYSIQCLGEAVGGKQADPIAVYALMQDHHNPTIK